MRKLLQISLMLLLTMLTVPVGVGVHLVRCAHTGHVRLADYAGPDSCGMSDNAGCMQHLDLQVSQYAGGAQPGYDAPSPVLLPPALLPAAASPVPACSRSCFISPLARSQAPPGPSLHSLLSLRN